jgi:hypothetical protein
MKQLNSLPNTKQENKTGIPENYRSVLKSEDYSSSFEQVETWLRNKNQENKFAQKERSLVKLKNYFFSHKIRIAYAVIFLAVVVAACNMPVVTHETMGHVLAWTIPANNPTAASLVDGLSWVDKSKLTVNENTDNGKSEILYTLTLPGTTEDQIEVYRKDLERIKDVTSIKILPLNEDVKRPLYSAALNKFFRINIDATNISDAELQQEVTRQLKEAGIENPNIEFKTDENGMRTFKMKLPDEQMKNSPGNFEVRVHDGNKEDVMKVVHNRLDGAKLKGKTDQEIREHVKQQNPDLNLQDNEIKITHEGDDVKVEVVRDKVDKK